MICMNQSGYVLRQIPKHKVTYVTCPDGTIVHVLGPTLNKDTVKAIIIAAEKKIFKSIL